MNTLPADAGAVLPSQISSPSVEGSDNSAELEHSSSGSAPSGEPTIGTFDEAMAVDLAMTLDEADAAEDDLDFLGPVPDDSEELPDYADLAPTGPRDRAQVWIFEHSGEIREFALALFDARSSQLLDRFPKFVRDMVTTMFRAQVGGIPEKIIEDLEDQADEEVLQFISELRNLCTYVDPAA